jgi:hypothetical protein
MANLIWRASLVGVVGTKGFALRYGPSGNAIASFYLACSGGRGALQQLGFRRGPWFAVTTTTAVVRGGP